MIDSKRLVAIFKKWQKISATGRRRISMDRKFCNKSVADKGHFVVYTVDRRRFVLPLQHLKSPVFIELFRMSEEAFGLTYNGPITLPCDGVFMEHVVELVKRKHFSKEAEKSLVFTLANRGCSTSSMIHPHERQGNRQILIYGF
ncbi:hypothetical protein AAC387_Pa07g1078 [Persea americana]